MRYVYDLRLTYWRPTTYDLRIYTAGWAFFSFLRAVRFSSRQFLRYEPETSGIDVTLLGVNNDIRSKSNSNGIMPN